MWINLNAVSAASISRIPFDCLSRILSPSLGSCWHLYRLQVSTSHISTTSLCKEARDHNINSAEMVSMMSDPHLGVYEEEELEDYDLDVERVPLLPRGPPCKRDDHRRDVDDLPNNCTIRETFMGDQKHVEYQGNSIWLNRYKGHINSNPRFRLLRIGVMMVFFPFAIWLVFVQSGLACSATSTASEHEVVLNGHTQFFPPAIQQSWAAYTPYFSVKPYTPPPVECKIDQVNIIQRHGARFPTAGATIRILTAVEHLKSATQYLDSRLTFLSNYTYTLGIADLIPFGALQSAESGMVAYSRYPHLFSRGNIPFVRASGGTRVVESATNWTSGFSLASHGAFNPVLSVILDEKLNDTLDDAMCPNAGDSDVQTGIWSSIYGTPIAARLNAQAPGAKVTAADISNLIPLCAFETLAKETPSPFCSLFTEEEFAQYEYNGDLDKYYGTGYGQDLGRVQGVGYINELLARLTGTPVRDNTQTNRTLDSSPLTFPLHRTLYADFSHDNQMIAIYAALGLFAQPSHLDPSVPDPKRTWITSYLTPFSGRMVTERMTCTTGRGKADTFVRILVDDAVQPLEFCGGDRNGLCKLSKFVDSQTYARNDGEGDFERCFS